MAIKNRKKDINTKEIKTVVLENVIKPPVKSSSIFIIKKQRVSEKSDFYKNQNKYVFETALRANKNKIREAIEKRYGVKILSLNTLIIKGKSKIWRNRISCRPSFKKAIVTLKAGDKIE